MSEISTNQSKRPDTMPASALTSLTTQELMDIYHNRRKHMEDVWGVLSYRMILLEKAEQENGLLIYLLKECAQALQVPTYKQEIDTTRLETLLERIDKAIQGHEELYGE